jgi:AcrR family transcriptional regulator
MTVNDRPLRDSMRSVCEDPFTLAIRVLLARGYEGTTTIAVAERAGVSVGSLYQYFPNKDSLIIALVQRHTADAIHCIDEALETSHHGDRESSIRLIVRARRRSTIQANSPPPQQLSRSIIEYDTEEGWLKVCDEQDHPQRLSKCFHGSYAIRARQLSCRFGL